jgi:hypothetical protein
MESILVALTALMLAPLAAVHAANYIIETAKESPATAAKTVELIAKRDCDMVVRAEFRVSSDPELLHDDADPTSTTPTATPSSSASPDGASPPPQPQDASKAIMKRLNEMTADIKAALAGPNKANVQSLFVAASGQIKSEDFVQGGKTLDELEQLVKPGKAGAPPQQRSSDLTAALAAWASARAATVGQLAKLVAAFKASNHPQAEIGIALLEAVIKKNLTQRPATLRQVDELVR